MRTRNRSRTPKLALGAATALTAALLLLWGTAGDGSARGDSGRDGGVPPPAGSAAGSAVAAPRSAVAAAGRGRYAAPRGSEFTWLFTAVARNRIELDVAGQSAAQQMVLRLAGPLTLLVVDRRDDELVAEVRLAGIAAHQGAGGEEHRSPALEEALALPVSVRMRDDGTVLGFAFDERANAFANNLVRSIVCGFRFVVPPAAPPAWEGEEEDPTGVAAVRYERLSGAEAADLRVRRTKTAYRTPPGRRQAVELQYEVRSVGHAELSPELGWLRSARGHETLTARADAAGVRTTTEYEASLEPTAHALRGPGALPAPGWDREWAPLDGGADTLAIAEGSERELSERELDGTTFASLFQELLALASARPPAAAALTAASYKLTLLVRLRPETLEQIGRVLATTPPVAADTLLGAVGAANTPAAQRFVAGVLADVTAADHLRQSALDAMIQVAEPDDAVLDSVRDLVRAPGTGRGLAANGLLVLGALGSRKPRSDRTDREALVAELVALEERCRAEGRLAHWLHALGNTGNGNTLPAIGRYLAHEAVAVRHAAVSALRQLSSPQATAALLERSRLESDARVRGLAVESLARRSDPDGLAFVADLLAREPRADIRAAAVTGLAKQHPRSEAVAAMLRRSAQQDASAEVRDLATKALTPQ